MTEQLVEKLHDVEAACLKILKIVRSVDLDRYLASELHRYSVRYLFVELGEAVYGAYHSDEKMEDTLPAGRAAIGMRNRIAHGYGTIDDEVVWKTATMDVPTLLIEVRSVLRERGLQ